MKFQVLIAFILILSSFSCTNNPSKVSEQNKNIIQLLFDEILNRGDLSGLENVFDINVIGHDPTSLHPIKGINRIRLVYELFFEAFPGAKYSIEDLVAENDKITVRWRIKGKHLTDFMDMKASGNNINVMGIIIYRLEDKKIIEYWGLFDSATVKKQIVESNKK
jgi:predicted ester cyclase